MRLNGSDTITIELSKHGGVGTQSLLHMICVAVWEGREWFEEWIPIDFYSDTKER